MYLKPRILHIDNSPAVTGAYKALLSWCRAATEFEHIWVLPEDAKILEEVKDHFTVYTLPFVEIGRSPEKLIAYLPALFQNGRRLAGIIRKERPDLIHANDLYNLVPYAARFFTRQHLPLVVHARMLRRSFPGRIYDFWKKLHLKRADRIIAVSEVIKRDWDNDRRVTVVYDPIIVTEHLPSYQWKEPVAGKPFRFLYLANYIRGKGQEDALEAIRLLKEQGITGFQVDFYGGTMSLEKNEAYKQSLQASIKANQLEHLVVLHDAITDVETAMKQYDAALHFSHSESFGMVCYEALYYGLPVISSDCGGPAEMMEPGVSGILLPVGDVKGFAAAMVQLIRNPQACSDYSRRASAFIRSRFAGSDKELNIIFAGLT